MKILHTLITVVLSLLSLTAFAQLAKVGPVDSSNGFPTYYEDSGDTNSVVPLDRLALELCLPDAAELSDGSCVLLAGGGLIPHENLPISFPDNFPIETFYFHARALTPLTGFGTSGNARLDLGLEASFVNGSTVVPGQQMVFTRVKYVFTAPVSGTYTIDTPYSHKTVHYSSNEIVRDQTDVGTAGCAAGDFSCPFSALHGSVGPFLRAVDPADNVTPLPFFQAHGNTYLANPAVVNNHVTGGTNGNRFMISVIPDGSATSFVIADTDQFQLHGRLFRGELPSATVIDKATYARSIVNPQGVVDVFATSKNGFGSVQATSLALDINFANPADPMISDVMSAPDLAAPTKFQVHIQNTNTSAPSSVTVTNNNGVPTVTNANVTDVVLITEARYENGNINVTASSSDEITPQDLIVKNTGSSEIYGNILGSGTLSVPTNSIPANITVSSVAGGQATMAVTVITTVPPVSNNPPSVVHASQATINPPVGNISVPQKTPVNKPKINISSIGLASESGGTGQFMVSLSAPCTKNINVKFNIKGNAQNGKDYRKITSSLLIPAGSESGVINVFAIDDKKREGRELITLKLAKDKSYSVGGATASVMIEDND